MDYQTHIAKSSVASALQQLSVGIKTSNLKVDEVIQVVTKPHGVRASAKVDKGHLILVPETHKIIALAKSECIGRDHSLSVSFEEDIGTKDFTLFLAPQVSSEFVCPAWHVEKTADRALANMAWKPITTSVFTIVELPECAKASAKATGKDHASTHKLKVPTLVNTKALKAGDTLMVYQEMKTAKREPVVLSAGQVVAKKMKLTRQK